MTVHPEPEREVMSPAERVASITVLLVMVEANGLLWGSKPWVAVSVGSLLLVASHVVHGLTTLGRARNRATEGRWCDPARLDAAGVAIAVILSGGLRPETHQIPVVSLEALVGLVLLAVVALHWVASRRKT